MTPFFLLGSRRSPTRHQRCRNIIIHQHVRLVALCVCWRPRPAVHKNLRKRMTGIQAVAAATSVSIEFISSHISCLLLHTYLRPAQMKCNRTEFVFKAFRNFKRNFIEFECSAILRPRTRILSCYISFALVLLWFWRGRASAAGGNYDILILFSIQTTILRVQGHMNHFF